LTAYLKLDIMPPGMAGRQTAPTSIMKPKHYKPTMEEFADFAKFIDKIELEDKANEAGFCKITPPKEWVPRKSGYNLEEMNYTIQGPIKQHFQTIGNTGCFQTKGIIQPKMSVLEYHKMTQSRKYATPAFDSYDDLERKYWKSVAYCPPVYGCDVSNNISDPELEVWNIAKLDSILTTVADEMGEVIQGVNSPYLYFGMWKATFSWHVEDMDLYAINMVHHGAPKTWYCVPPKYGHLLEKACRQLFPNVASFCSNFMRHKTCLLNPSILDKYGVPYQKLVQEERDIIVVFPYAYHSGFNHGFNIAESTNFATERWIEYGKRQRPCDCDRARVRFSMDPFILKYHGPEALDKWKKNLDIAPHPQDPPEVVLEIEERAKNPEKWAMEQAEKQRELEEKKLKQYELKKIQREEKRKEMEAAKQAAKLNETTNLIHKYRMKEDATIEIEIDPLTKTVLAGRDKLEEHLKTSDFDVSQLIKSGVLYKSGDKRVPKRKPSQDLSSDPSPREMTETCTVAMFKHVAKESLHITVDPVTMELTTKPSTELVDFLKDIGDKSIKQLIEASVFVKVCDCIMEVKKVEKSCQAPSAKKIKLEQTTPAPKSAPKLLDIYRHKETGDHFTISAQKKKLIGRLKDDKKILFENTTAEELIDQGILIKVGSRRIKSEIDHAVFKMMLDENERRIEIASVGDSTVISFMNDEELETALLSGNVNYELLQNESEFLSPRMLLDALLSIIICSKCQLPQVNDCLTCQRAFEQAESVLGKDFSIKEGWVFVTEKRSYIIQNERMPQSLFEPPKMETHPSPEEKIDDTEGQNDDKYVEDEKVEDDNLYLSDDDDDEEELFTSDESSESNDESSDDPDYTSGNIKEWKSVNRSKKKKMKKQRMMEREERMKKFRKRKWREPGSSKAKKQVDTVALVELTKQVLAHPFEIGKEFDYEAKATELAAAKGRLNSVLRILCGFQIAQKVDRDTVHSLYVWKGHDEEVIQQVLKSVLESEEPKIDFDDLDLWNICQIVLRALLVVQKGWRIFLPIIAQGLQKQRRRFEVAASVLEGLGLTRKQPDDLGGYVYTGPDNIYSDYQDRLFNQHREEFNLKTFSLKLEQAEVKEEHRYTIIPPAFDLKADLEYELAKLPEDIANDPEIQRAIINKGRVCRCGTSKAMNKEVMRKGKDGVKRQVRTTVMIGGRRKIRCKKCPGCTTPPCRKCRFCTTPSMKKPCELRVCQFPTVPKCPCFL